MPRKMPFRPGNEISQTYNDGIARIYAVSDGAMIGYQPELKAKLTYQLPFAERVLGINRLFLGRQNRVEISRVLRIPRVQVSALDLVKLHDGSWYSIDSVQSVEGIYPPSLDLSLVAEKRKIEVIE